MKYNIISTLREIFDRAISNALSQNYLTIKVVVVNIYGYWRQLKIFVPKSARTLAVGCSESLLSHELLAKGYEVWNIDINDYFWCCWG